MMEKISSTQSILHGGSLGDLRTYLVGYPAWKFTYQKELHYSKLAVTVSKSLKSELIVEMGQKYEHKLRFLHNGVNIEALDKTYGKCDDHVEESDETILFAGRLFWRKGALNIIAMAYLLQKKQANFRIIVHGDGPLFNKMRAKISSLGLKNIELKGFTAKEELVESMKRSKFVAIPSIYEACPMILLESMCLGKIPLMLNLPFSSELTENGKYGLLANDAKGLIEQLTSAKKNFSIDYLSKEIRTFARNTYDINSVASKYINIYREFC
jgi:glycosyltransferase involved in cell wall biosynthesis